MMGRRGLTVITGGSRGIGQALAVALSKQQPQNDFVLIARSSLGATRDLMKTNLSTDSEIFLHQIDLSDASNLQSNISNIFHNIDASRYESGQLFHNAGSLGALNYIRTLGSESPLEIQSFYCLNMTSVIFLTSAFLNFFNKTSKLTVVNISSGAAWMPYESWSLYCSVKAARKMFHQVLAKEEEKNNVRVLNYSPGIIVTQMQTEIQAAVDSSTKQFLGDVVKKGRDVPVDVSMGVLLNKLEEDKFENGSSIDLYDVKPEYAPWLDK